MITLHKLKNIDRSIFHQLRTKLIAKGHLVDIENYTTEADYITALKSLDFPIQVKGMGMSDSKDIKEVNSIVIDRKPFEVATLGGGTTYYTEIKDVDGTVQSYVKGKYPERSLNIPYEVRSIATSIKEDRYITMLIFEILGIDRHLPIVDSDSLPDTVSSEHLMFMGDINVSSVDFIERLFKYTFYDIWLSIGSDTNEEIPALTNISLKVGETTSEKIIITRDYDLGN